jgi:uncharacterized protein YggE
VPKAAKGQVLVVVGKFEDEVIADRAEAIVSVSASNYFFGNAAFDKARELAQLASALTELGIPREALSLESAVADVTKGLLSSSTSATYRIRISIRDVNLLPQVIGAIASQKQATLEEIDWRYPEGPEVEARWLAACGTGARTKADALAAALGLRIAGVNRGAEHGAMNIIDTSSENAPRSAGYGGPPGMRRSMAAPGFVLAHKKTVKVQVTVEFLLAPLSTAT